MPAPRKPKVLPPLEPDDRNVADRSVADRSVDDRLVAPEPRAGDDDKSLRPTTFDEFVGQARVVENLRTWTQAAQRSARPLDHILFTGPPGLGKTTLAHLVASTLGAEMTTTSGPVLERPRDLAGMLTKLGRGDVLFIDEIHRLRTHVEEYLYSAMEDFKIDLAIDEGPYARSVTVPLQRFTLIGATTRAGLLSKPFRDRFGIQERLMPYEPLELERIVTRSARVLGMPIAGEAAAVIARRARGTPRIANRFLARVRDVAQAGGQPRITEATAEQGLAMLGVDQEGLDELDRRILAVLAESPGTAVGLKTLAVATGEEEGTIEEVYEPYLIVRGFVRKTARGRVLGPNGLALLGIDPPPPPPPGDPARLPQGMLFA
ncbi:MAG: Holliday junction branch migration DNA helicase RuvB [Planctomycetes bacterium]|nr:Holliday junction branch migration DNA helicase RuvB [Planctomycetota bacterium]